MQIDLLQQGFGAEVRGFDLRSVADADVAALKAAYSAHDLLVFRDLGALSGEDQAQIAGWFGPLGANRDASGNNWTTLDNAEPTGREVLPFHMDVCFFEHPFAGLSLHPLELPDEATSTTFVSNAVGWEALGDELKDLLRGRRAHHGFHDQHLVAPDLPLIEFWHPARMIGAGGREMLFVSENHVRCIEGFSEADSAPILAKVFAALYAPERRYEHVWQRGDLLVWNNRAIQHARTRKADPAAGKRVMQRVALGDYSFGELLAERRSAAGAGTVALG